MRPPGAAGEGSMASQEDQEADAEALFGQLYGELHGLAERIFRSQPRGHTLQPTALVNEAFMKVARAAAGGAATPRDREHMLNLAARAMRQILVNHARDKAAAKRGGGDAARQRVTLSAQVAREVGGSELDLLALEEELDHLAALDERQARIVELKVFAGMTTAEIAAAIGVSTRTVEMDWQMARRWLALRLAAPGGGSA